MTGFGSGCPRYAARVQDAVSEARRCYEQRKWADAYERFAAADREHPLSAEDLERLAWSAGLTGRDEEMIKAHERLHAHHLEMGAPLRAVRSAFWIALRLMSMGERARAGGWLTRAERLLEGEPSDSVERGYLLLPATFRYNAQGDLVAAEAAATRAMQLGDRFGEADLSAFGRNLLGRNLIRQGQLARGLALLDEAMLSATTGELSPILTGVIYCGVIEACTQSYALDRAREWTAALGAWCEAQPQLVQFAGACQVHRAEIMQLGGAWSESIEAAQHASARLLGVADQGVAADAFYQQAEIHRLRGELSAADEAYREASQRGREPQPGLSLLRVAQGRIEAAATAMRRVLDTAQAPLQRARFLPAHVEIMLAAGDLTEARRASDELAGIAAALQAPVLEAIALQARGAVLVAEGDARAALPPLREAFGVWRELGAPYLAARVRVLIARACGALGDDDGAALEQDGARGVFERLGAAPDLAQLEAPAPTASARAASAEHGLSPRELQVLRLVAAGKTNKLIARELFLSEKTIDRHVSNIFTKLSVSSRAAATAYAYQHALV